MKTNISKKIGLAFITMTISGILMFTIASIFFISQDLDYAAGNDYARTHITEHITFSMLRHVCPLTLMNMIATIPVFIISELFFQKMHTEPKTSKKFQLIGTPLIATSLFILILIIHVLSNFSLTF